MPPVLFSYVSTLGLIDLILGGILTLLLFRIPGKQRHTWWLAMVFLCLTVMMGLFLFLVSVPHQWASFGLLGLIFIDLSILCLLQFGYSFPFNSRPREARFVSWFYSIVIAVGFASLLMTFSFDSDGWLRDYHGWVFGALAAQSFRLLAVLWLAVIWLRKIVYLENDPKRNLIKKLLAPKNPETKTIRAFFFSFSIVLLLPLTIIAEFFGITGRDLTPLIFSWVILILFTVFFVIYINYLPASSSFLMKFVGITLFAVLSSLAITSLLANGTVHERYKHLELTKVDYCRQAVLRGETGPWPEGVRYVVRRAPGETSFSAVGTAVTYAELARLNTWAQKAKTRQEKIDEITQRHPSFAPLKELEKPDPIDFNGITYSAGQRTPDWSTMGLSERDIFYQFALEDGTYQVGFSYLDYRMAFHDLNGQLAGVAVVLSLGILLFFPIFFDRGITQPVRSLLRGVHQVNEGRLDVRVNVHTHDEIGYVAGAFNRMVASIAGARKEALDQERERTRLESENQRKSKELEAARQLQLSMLPKNLPNLEGVEVAAYTNPATEVGGDYYDFHTTQNCLTFVIGDATGHGLQAGTMVTATKGLFNALAPEFTPLELLQRSADALGKMGFEMLLMGLLIGRLEKDNLTVAAAGMPYALIHRGNSNLLERVELKGLPLGSGIPFPYQEAVLPFHPGDTLLLCSDGLGERFNPKQQMLGYEAVEAAFLKAAQQTPQALIDALITLGETWAEGQPADDDITLVVVKKQA